MAEELKHSSLRLAHSSNGAPYIQLQVRGQAKYFLTTRYKFDALPMTSILSDPRVFAHLQNTPHPYELSHAESWILLQTSKDESPMRELPLSAIRESDPETGVFIGSAGLVRRGPEISYGSSPQPSSSQSLTQPRNEPEFYLGYYLDPSYQGHGIMAAAVQAALFYASDCRAPPVKVVLCQVADDNISSRRTIERVDGFKKCPIETVVVKFPEAKGGAMKRLEMWKWTASS